MCTHAHVRVCVCEKGTVCVYMTLKMVSQLPYVFHKLSTNNLSTLLVCYLGILFSSPQKKKKKTRILLLKLCVMVC